jgi:hypothetical protein
MYNNVTGSDNTSLGHLSLVDNFDGIRNTAIGSNSLYSNVHGSSNVSIGWNSMFANEDGDYNTSIGTYSLNANTYGYGNVSVGNQAMLSNTSGIYNVGIGFQVLNGNTSGSSNIAIGYGAAASQESVDGSVAIGNFSLLNNYTGEYNTAIGTYSLYRINSGNRNTAVGYLSVYNSELSNDTSAFGNESLYNLYSGNNNVGIGASSLYYLEFGSDNIGLGWKSLFNLTAGDQNIGIGSNTTLDNDLDSNSIVIGYNAVGLGSNTVVLGNASITKTILRGYVGIGTTNPTFSLHVVGSDASINTLKIGLGGGQVSRNVSIGDTSIGQSGSGNTGDYLLAIGYRPLRFNTTGRANVAIGNEAMAANTTGSYNSALSIQALLRNTTGNNNTAVGVFSHIWNTTGNNNVAVGYASGNSVNGTFGSISGSYNIFLGSENYGGITTGSYNVIIGSQVTGLPSSTANNIVLADGQGNIRFRDNGVSTILSRLVGTGTRMVVVNASGELSTQTIGTGSVTGSGTTNYVPKWSSASSIGNSLIYDDGTNIGIGTTTPSQKLDVNGAIIASSYVIAGNDFYGSNVRVNGFYANTIAYMPFYSNASPYGEIMRMQNNGNVLIGSTTDNGCKLQVNGPASFTNSLIITGSDNNLLPISGGIKIYNDIALKTSYISTGKRAVEGYALDLGGDPIIFRNSNLDTEIARFTSGNLLIGATVSSGYRLQVNGTSYFNDTVNVRKPSSTTCYIYIGDSSNNYSNIQFTQAANFYTIGATAGGAFSFVNGANNGYIFTLNSDATATLNIGGGNKANFSGRVGIGGWSNIYTLSNMLTVIGATSIGTTEALNVANPASILFSVNSITQGVLLPRLTTAQILAITPATGLLLYNSDLNVYGFYNGTEWRKFTDELMFA